MTEDATTIDPLEEWSEKIRQYTVTRITNILKQFEYTEGLDKKIVFNGTARGLANHIALNLEIPEE